jgi:hypothetical protein
LGDRSQPRRETVIVHGDNLGVVVNRLRRLLTDVSAGIRVLHSRDGVQLSENQILERARNIVMGGNHVNFGTVGGPPYAHDLERGRRTGTLADFTELVKLAQALNIVHFMAGSAPEPQDVPVPIRHMVMARTLLGNSDKIPFGSTITPARIEDVFELVRMARGVSREQMLREPSYYSVINTNSPMQLDGAMAWGVIGFAERNQALCITPFTLLGAMAPVTIAGAIAQQNAEALAAITLSQIVRPGAPLIYGGFTSNVDMRSGAPAFGTPEYIKACLIGGQMARRYNMPYRSSNTNASVWPDAQATYEGAMSIWGALMGGTNMLLHGVGWLEGGLVASYEKYIIDAEMLQTMAEFFTPTIVDDSTLAIDAIRVPGARSATASGRAAGTAALPCSESPPRPLEVQCRKCRSRWSAAALCAIQWLRGVERSRAGLPQSGRWRRSACGRDCEFAAEPDSGPSAGSSGWPKAAICVPAELAVPATSSTTTPRPTPAGQRWSLGYRRRLTSRKPGKPAACRCRAGRAE